MGVEVKFVDSAGFDRVALALFGSMLAGECPTASILGSSGIAIGIEVELTDLPEIFGSCSSFEGSFDESETIRA